MATDGSGNVYVSDRSNFRIQKFDPNGAFITAWGSPGSGDGQFGHVDGPSGVATDANGNVFVADYENERIEKFDSSGAFIAKWGASGAGAVTLLSDGRIVVGGGAQVGTFLGCGLALIGIHGTFDPTFGVGGQLRMAQLDREVCYVTSLTTDAAGMILAAGQYTTARAVPKRYFNLMRLDTAGSLDLKFGKRGLALTSVYKPLAKTGSIGAYDVLVQPDGFIVEVGGLGGADLGLARFRPNGRLDRTFASHGTARVDRLGGYGTSALDGAKAVRLLADGRLVVAGDLGARGSFGVGRFLGKPCAYTVATSTLICN